MEASVDHQLSSHFIFNYKQHFFTIHNTNINSHSRKKKNASKVTTRIFSQSRFDTYIKLLRTQFRFCFKFTPFNIICPKFCLSLLNSFASISSRDDSPVTSRQHLRARLRSDDFLFKRW